MAIQKGSKKIGTYYIKIFVFKACFSTLYLSVYSKKLPCTTVDWNNEKRGEVISQKDKKLILCSVTDFFFK